MIVIIIIIIIIYIIIIITIIIIIIIIISSSINSCSARAKHTLFLAKSARTLTHFIFAITVRNNYGIIIIIRL